MKRIEIDGQGYELVPEYGGGYGRDDVTRFFKGYLLRPIEAKPEKPQVKILVNEENNGWVGIKFPMRHSAVWVRDSDLDALKDYLLSFEADEALQSERKES